MAEDKRVYIGLKFKIGIFVVIAVILLAVFAGFRAGRMIYKDKQPEITTAYISEKINGVSELTTAEMVYSGLIIYSEGEIPLLIQWDKRWGYETYGDDLMALSGCGPACLSMVYVGLTGDTDMNPKAMARWRDDTNWHRIGMLLASNIP